MIKWLQLPSSNGTGKYDASYMRDVINAIPRAAWLLASAPRLDSSGVPASVLPVLPAVLADNPKACMRIVVGGTPVLFGPCRVPARADVAVRTA